MEGLGGGWMGMGGMGLGKDEREGEDEGEREDEREDKRVGENEGED